MKISKVIRTDDAVEFHHEVQGHQAVETRKITAHEAPLKGFDTALQKLADVAVNILEVGQPYKKGITIISLTVSYTGKGTRSATIVGKKELDATGKPHRFDTPQFRFDDAAEGEEGRRECTKAHAEMIQTVIDETEKYANGERQQRLLPLDDGKGAAAEPAQGDVLKFSTPEAASEEQATPPEKPKSTPKAKK
jgi:hypothetical protein